MRENTNVSLKKEIYKITDRQCYDLSVALPSPPSSNLYWSPSVYLNFHRNFSDQRFNLLSRQLYSELLPRIEPKWHLFSLPTQNKTDYWTQSKRLISFHTLLPRVCCSNSSISFSNTYILKSCNYPLKSEIFLHNNTACTQRFHSYNFDAPWFVSNHIHTVLQFLTVTDGFYSSSLLQAVSISWNPLNQLSL